MQQLTTDLTEYTCKECAVALGTFDGLHIGHQRIIDNARSFGLPVTAYSFANIPAAFFGRDIRAILSREEKTAAFAEYGVDHLMMVPFDEVIMNMPARDFLDFLYYKLNARVISCGFNYSFGKKAEGNPAFLQAYAEEKGIRAIISPPIMMGEEPVSSTLIRTALKDGNIRKANEMLGKRYFIMGTVQHGKRLGNKIGFPTVNLPFPEEKLCPKAGVYAACVTVEGREYPAMTNIGVRPTVESTNIPNAETYIIGFDGDLYGKQLRVELIDFIRPEVKFASVDELKNQLKKDEKTALQTYKVML